MKNRLRFTAAILKEDLNAAIIVTAAGTVYIAVVKCALMGVITVG